MIWQFIPGGTVIPPGSTAPAVVDPIDEIDWAKIKLELAERQRELVRRYGAKPIPTNCADCGHYNEYAGPEHCIDGQYVCRDCRPRRKS